MRAMVVAAAAAFLFVVFPGASAPSTCQGSATKPPHCTPGTEPEVKVGRLWTSGAEWNDATAEGATVGAGISFSSAVVRTGALAYASSGTTDVRFTNYTPTLGVTQFLRAYMYFTNVSPAANVAILDLGTGKGRVTLNTDGTLGLVRNASPGTEIGRTTAVMPTNEWILVELGLNIDTGSVDTIEGRVNGVTFASATGQTISDAATARASVFVGDGTNTWYADDIALNDSAGASQNSWPGPGKVVLLKPISDNAGGAGWTLGTGTALGGNGFAALDNTPPTGVADLAALSDPKQIRNASANANTNYDANMTSYTTAGIAAGGIVNVVVPMVATAAPVVTSAKAGTVGVVSNPAITNVALGAGGTPGAFWSGAAGAAYPTGWKWSFGTTTYAPSVTLGTSPVMRITQVTSSTRIAVVCAMGIYVDYTPPASLVLNPYRQAASIYHF